jgi:hypothetical protein
MWINQPSGLQPHHDLHGFRALVEMDPRPEVPEAVCYWLEGPILWSLVPKIALSEGWPESSRVGWPGWHPTV